MPIWGRRDSEPSAEEAHEGQAAAQPPDQPAQAPAAQAPATQAAQESTAPAAQEPGVQESAAPGAPGTPEPAGEQQAEEAAPAFWRAQGRTTAPVGQTPSDAGAPVGRPPSDADAPAAVLDEETAVKDPALTGTGGDKTGPPGAEAARPPVVAGNAGPPAVTGAVAAAPADAQEAAISAQRWSEILVTFVDDPHGSVKMAADAVDEAVDEFVNSVRARQRALSSSWQGTETGTEQLRTALRDYRTLWHQVQRLDLGGKTGS